MKELFKSDLTPTAKLIYIYLQGTANEHAISSVNTQEISSALNISLYTVRVGVEQLVSNGYVNRTKDPDSTRIKYLYEILK